MRLCLLIIAICAVQTTFSKGGRGGGRGHSSGRSHSSSHSRSSSSRKFSYKTSTTGSIERTSLFRSTVFGGRYLSFAAGRHIIVAPALPIIFDKRHYYWDSSYINPNETYPTVCVNKIDPQDPQFGRVFYENETKPKEIAYGCEDEEAYCCGYECCEESGIFTGLFRLLILILVLSILCVFCIEAVRWTMHCCYMCRKGKNDQRENEPFSL